MICICCSVFVFDTLVDAFADLIFSEQVSDLYQFTNGSANPDLHSFKCHDHIKGVLLNESYFPLPTPLFLGGFKMKVLVIR